MKYGFGVDLGGTTVKIAYFNEEGNLLHKWEIPTITEGSGSQILPDIAASINGFLFEKGIDKESVIGIGIGVPGPVDGKGIVNKCINLGWGVFNIHDALGELTGLPVRAGNDANVAALGESWKGGGEGWMASLSAVSTAPAARSATWCSISMRPRSVAAASMAAWSSIAPLPALSGWQSGTWLFPTGTACCAAAPT